MIRQFRDTSILLVFLFLYGIAAAQKNMHEDIKKFYTSFEKSGDTYDPPIRFINASDTLVGSDVEVLQIMLIRHAVPKIKRKGWTTFYEADDLRQAYDTVEVYEISDSPVRIHPEEVENIRSSPLIRARSTAEQLFKPNYTIIYDSTFIEFRNEIIPIPWIKLPLKFWKVTSRLFWMAGLHSENVPSLSNEKQRARAGAAKLAKWVKEEKRIVLVAHGFLNRYLIRYLKKAGWQHSFDGGYSFSNVQVLTKIIEP